MAEPTGFASGFEMALMSMQMSAIISVLHRAGLVDAEEIFEHVQEQAVVLAVHMQGSEQLKAALGQAMESLRQLVDSLGAFDSR